MKLHNLILSLMGFALVLTSCAPKVSSIDKIGARKPLVVTTTAFSGDLVDKLAGDFIELVVLVPSDMSPHAFVPSARELVPLEKADLVVASGLGLESEFLPNLADLVKGRLLDLSANIVALEHEEHEGEAHEGEEPDGEEDEHGDVDPHVWYSPRSALVWLKDIEGALVSLVPEQKAEIEKRALDLQAKISKLDNEFAGRIAALEAKNRILASGHRVLSYLARDYGLTIVGEIIESPSDQVEASPRHIQDLVQKLKESGARAIVTSEGEGEALAKLAKEVGKEAGGIPVIAIPGDTLGTDYITYLTYTTDMILGAIEAK